MNGIEELRSGDVVEHAFKVKENCRLCWCIIVVFVVGNVFFDG
jgi:hypothetical protein